MFDGEKIVVPDLPGLEFVDPKDEWYKEQAKIFADYTQFYVILHGHEDDLYLQFFVMREKKGYQQEKGVKHLTDRLWLFQTTDRQMLSAYMLCSGKVVNCMLFRFRNENEINKKMSAAF